MRYPAEAKNTFIEKGAAPRTLTPVNGRRPSIPTGRYAYVADRRLACGAHDEVELQAYLYDPWYTCSIIISVAPFLSLSSVTLA